VLLAVWMFGCLGLLEIGLYADGPPFPETVMWMTRVVAGSLFGLCILNLVLRGGEWIAAQKKKTQSAPRPRSL